MAWGNSKEISRYDLPWRLAQSKEEFDAGRALLCQTQVGFKIKRDRCYCACLVSCGFSQMTMGQRAVTSIRRNQSLKWSQGCSSWWDPERQYMVWVSSLTVIPESVLISATFDAKEDRDVATCDIPNAIILRLQRKAPMVTSPVHSCQQSHLWDDGFGHALLRIRVADLQRYKFGLNL